MVKPSQVILKVRKNIQGIEKVYVNSPEFKLVAGKALIDFIKRVKRGFMPDLGEIPSLENDQYIELRTKNKSSLGDLAKPKKSNATATGQMLKAMKFQMKPNGFLLFVDSTKRAKEISGYPSKLNNKEVASYYAKARNIFSFSAPELDRIIRNVRSDLLKLIRRLK